MTSWGFGWENGVTYSHSISTYRTVALGKIAYDTEQESKYLLQSLISQWKLHKGCIVGPLLAYWLWYLNWVLRNILTSQILFSKLLEFGLTERRASAERSSLMAWIEKMSPYLTVNLASWHSITSCYTILQSFRQSISRMTHIRPLKVTWERAVQNRCSPEGLSCLIVERSWMEWVVWERYCTVVWNDQRVQLDEACCGWVQRGSDDQSLKETKDEKREEGR